MVYYIPKVSRHKLCSSFSHSGQTETHTTPTIKWHKIHIKIRIIDHKLVMILSSSSMCEVMLSSRVAGEILIELLVVRPRIGA